MEKSGKKCINFLCAFLIFTQCNMGDLCLVFKTLILRPTQRTKLWLQQLFDGGSWSVHWGHADARPGTDDAGTKIIMIAILMMMMMITMTTYDAGTKIIMIVMGSWLWCWWWWQQLLGSSSDCRAVEPGYEKVNINADAQGVSRFLLLGSFRHATDLCETFRSKVMSGLKDNFLWKPMSCDSKLGSLNYLQRCVFN